MNPVELVALTPRTNCGECGYPACLAFAVAVTKGGAYAGSCPYIKTDSLPSELLQGSADGGLDTVARSQDERDMALVSHLKGKIKDVDFSLLAPRLGAELLGFADEVSLRFAYLGQSVVLGKKSLLVDGAELVDPRDQILLYNYVAFGGGQAPVGNWLGMESLPNSISKVRTLSVYCEEKLAAHFKGRGNALQGLCLQLSGELAKGEQVADMAVIVPVLPFIPLQVLFWDEDLEDGFSAKVKVLFDEKVMDFLDLESLVFTAERLAERLISLDEL